MSDDIESDQEKSETQLDEEQLTSRRSFTKSGVAGGAVLMSLLSRPVLGGGLECTPSILASVAAGTSQHQELECDFGCTPGFWCFGQPPDILAWEKIFTESGFAPGDQFSAVFNCAGPSGPGPGFDSGTTLNDILCIPNESTSFLKQAARHSIAALLNAIIFGAFFSSLTPQNIIDMYCDAFEIWFNTATDPNDPNDPDANTGPLQSLHLAMAELNERNDCPLNNDPNNFFFNN